MNLKVQQTDIDLNGKHFRFICDAPSRAFVKCIKEHNSFYVYEKCEQEQK